MRVATNIQWNIDLEENETCNLPNEIEIPNTIDEEDISNYLSDKTGFCHAGFCLTER